MAQLSTLAHMTRSQKIWDFVFGVAVISGAPIVTLCAISFVAPLILSSYVGRSSLPGWTIIAIGAVTFLGACVWRRKHRQLPSSLFAAEVLTAILAGGLFLFVLSAALYAAYRAD